MTAQLPDDDPIEFRQTSDTAATKFRQYATVSGHPYDTISRAHDNTITDNDKVGRRTPLYDGIDAPYLEEELKVRYCVEFVRTPVSERCVFCNAAYLGETKIVNLKHEYSFLNHVWLVDFLRANYIDFDETVPGLLLIASKKWRNAGLPSNPKDVFVGLSAVKADRHRNVIAIESLLELNI